MHDLTENLNRFKEAHEAKIRQHSLETRLLELLESTWTIAELREAVALYDRATGALQPTTHVPPLPVAGVPRPGPRIRKSAHLKECVCSICSQRFLSLKRTAFICPSPSCRAHQRAVIAARKAASAQPAINAKPTVLKAGSRGAS